MSKRTLLPAVLGITLLASAHLPTSSAPKLEKVQKESEHKKVGEMIAECITAYVAREGRREAEADLNEYLEKKWSKGAKGLSPLSLSDDLAEALWYATDYSKVKGVKKGRVDDLEVPVSYYGDDYVSNASVWVPKKYTPKEKYALILCIPDSGVRPQDYLNDQWADDGVRDGAVIIALGMPESTANWGSLGDPKNAGGMGVLLQTFKQASETFAIDFDRVFLAGHGLGVQTAMQIASAFPDRFSGVVGRSGDAAEISPDNMSNLPCFFAGAGKRANDYADKVKEAGFDPCTVQADAKLDQIWAWMEVTSRRSNPEKVVLHPGSPFPNKAYWIAVPAAEYTSDARLVATADRASNTITIEAKGIQTVTIYLNDSIVDLEKPVKVICNGAVSEDEIPRNFNSMMDGVYRSRSDPGKLYTAFRKSDIPSAEAPTDKKDATSQPN